MWDNKTMLASQQQTESLVNLFHQGRRLTYNKGEFVIRPGEISPGVFYIEKGLVKAYDITKYGEENLLIIRKPGELLSLTWAITGENINIIYSAIAPTTVWCISKDDFLEHIKTDPSLSVPILDMVTDMYRQHSKRIINLEYRSVRERLISFLLSTSDRFGDKLSDNKVVITVPLRQQDIASSINATRETTGRQLAYLQKHKLISTKQSLITLLDVEKLQSYL
jgi:CRP/FNR family transcriptional regulator